MTDCAYCSPPYRPCICGGGDPSEARHPDPESCGICDRPLHACRCLEHGTYSGFDEAELDADGQINS